MNLMYYVVNKDTTLLHQINDDINKVYQKKSADFYSNKCLETMFTNQTNNIPHVESRKQIIRSNMKGN